MALAPVNKETLWSRDDLEFAFECAADFLEAEDWPENDGGAQVAAFREAAKRIRRMVKRSARVAPSPGHRAETTL